MAYGYFRNLAKRTASDEFLRDKAFNIAKNVKYDGCKGGLASMVYKFFNKKISPASTNKFAGKGIKNELKQNQQLVNKPIIKKVKNRRVYSSFKDIIWGADLADVQSICKFNKRILFLLCVIDLSIKYAWVVSLKDKKGVTIINAFQKVLNESDRKPNKIWADISSEFYNRWAKSWLEKNDIEMYLTQNEGKSVVAERFIRTLKNKIYKYMPSISKSVYIDTLDGIVNEYNNAHHRTIKVKSVYVKRQYIYWLW